MNARAAARLALAEADRHRARECFLAAGLTRWERFVLSLVRRSLALSDLLEHSGRARAMYRWSHRLDRQADVNQGVSLAKLTGETPVVAPRSFLLG